MNNVLTFEQAIRLAKEGKAVRCIDWNRNDFISRTEGVNLAADKFWSQHNKDKAIELGGNLQVVDSFTRYNYRVGVSMGWTPSTLDMFSDWVGSHIQLLPTRIEVSDETHYITYELIGGSDGKPHPYLDLVNNLDKEIIVLTGETVDHSMVVDVHEMLLATTKDVINFNGECEITVTTSPLIYVDENELIDSAFVVSEHGAFGEVITFINGHPDCLDKEDFYFIIDVDTTSNPKTLHDQLATAGIKSIMVSINELITGVPAEPFAE